MAARKGNGDRSDRRSAAKRPTKAELARLEKQTGREKSRSIAKRIFVAVLIVVLVAILGFAGFGIAYVATGGFGGTVPTAIVMIEDKIYADSADGLTIYPGDEVVVYDLTGDAEYTLRIKAAEKETNFAFFVGDEPYTWRDLNGYDVTSSFTIDRTERGFIVNYAGIEDIIASVCGADVTFGDDIDLSGDMFDLVLTSGEKEYVFGFGVGLPVTDIVLPDNVII